MSWFFQKRKTIDYEQFKVSAENQNKQYELMSGITDIKLNGYARYKLVEWRGLQERQYRMSQKFAALRADTEHWLHLYRPAAQHLHHLLDCGGGGERQSHAGHDDEHIGHHRTGERTALAAHRFSAAVSGRKNKSRTLGGGAALPR